MSLKTIWILMVAFLSIGTFAIYDYLVLEDERESKKEQEQHVVWLKGKKLSSIKIQKGSELIRFECESKEGCTFDGTANWLVKEPVQDIADSSSVASLASSILNLTFQDKIDFDTPLDEAEFGLAESKLWAEIQLVGDSTPLKFKLGRSAPVGPNVYLQLNGETNRLFTVATLFSEMFDKDLFHWRNKRIFPGATVDAVDSLAWTFGNKKFAAKKEKGVWMLSEPVSALADYVMVESLVNTVVFASAKAEAKANASTKGLQKSLEVSFVEKGNEQRFTLWEGADSLASSIDPKKLFVVDRIVFERFRKGMVDFRDRKILKNSPSLDSIEELTFEFPKDRWKATLKRVGGQWQSDKASEDPISQDRINKFLRAYVSLEAKDFKGQTDRKVFNSKVPDAVVTSPQLAAQKFVILNRKIATTEYGEQELAHLSEDFTKLLPVREVDLRESGNKQVVEELKGEPHGESFPPGGDHSGHNH